MEHHHRAGQCQRQKVREKEAGTEGKAEGGDEGTGGNDTGAGKSFPVPDPAGTNGSGFYRNTSCLTLNLKFH